MNIRIEGITAETLKKISSDLETERWYTSMWVLLDGNMSVELNPEVTIKIWSPEIMIGLAGKNSFIVEDEFTEMHII